MRKHILQNQLAVFILFLMVLVPVVQSSLLNRSQTTLASFNTLSEEKASAVVSADSVYPLTPDWVSDSPHYSTGGAFADFNNDGWLDFIVSDGNDMGQGHVRLYMNDGEGALPTTATWQSADIAYNGHLDVTDINGDGWCDVAVAYLGTGSSLGPIARVYMNNNGILSSSPSWTANIIGNAFGVDFGDMNNDGRPDLAIATGWSYDSYHYHTYVYLNSNGAYGSTPSWQSADQNIYMNCLWMDADDDGWLDLAAIADSTQTQIYRNLGGTLETTASWYTTDSANQFGIMLTAGDVTGDGIRDLFTTDNTQLGGDGYFKQYTGLSTGFFETTHSWGYYGNYGSSVALSDVNGDGLLDLATGAWWDSTNLFLNQGTSLPTSPSWSSASETVVEKIVFGDIGPTLCEQVFVEQFDVSGDHRLFYLPHRQIQGINTVVCDGVSLDATQFTCSRDEGWITVCTNPQQSLEVTYRYSASQDMAVTNWDPDIGNYLYYNRIVNDTLPYLDHAPFRGSDLECAGSLSWDDITPGATIQGTFTVSNVGDPGSLLNWEVRSSPEWGTWTFTPSAGAALPAGETITVQVTVVVPNEQNTQYDGTVCVINSNKTGDHDEIPVTLTTPYLKEQQARFIKYPIVLEHLRSIVCIFQKPLS